MPCVLTQRHRADVRFPDAVPLKGGKRQSQREAMVAFPFFWASGARTQGLRSLYLKSLQCVRGRRAPLCNVKQYRQTASILPYTPTTMHRRPIHYTGPQFEAPVMKSRESQFSKNVLRLRYLYTVHLYIKTAFV